MAYYYTNYYASVRGYSKVKINFPAETSSWIDGETVRIGSPQGTPFIFNVSSTLFNDTQPNGTVVSDLSPYSSQSSPRQHPRVGGGTFNTTTNTPGNAFGTYTAADSSVINGTSRDTLPDSTQFLVLDTNLTGAITPGTKIYNTNHLITTGEAIDLTASWRVIPDTKLTGALYNAFCSVKTSNDEKIVVYSFGGTNDTQVITSLHNNVWVCTASTSNAGLKLDISPWYSLDENKTLWRTGANASTGFKATDGTAQAGIAPQTIPIAVGIAKGAACVDTVTNTIYFGGGVRDLYVGSADMIFGSDKIYGWSYDPTTGMLTGSSFVAGIMPMGRADHEMFVANGFLYCVGGFTGTYNTGTWAQSMANVTCSSHEHIHRALIANDGRLTDWAMCTYELPPGVSVSGAGAGIVDGAAFIYPNDATETTTRYIHLVGGVKSFLSASTYYWRSSGQSYNAELNYTGSAAYLPDKHKLGVDATWMGPSEGETLTTGPSLGPNDIRPVFPLLEDIYQQLVVPTSPGSQLPENKKLIGYRPGLRGTDILGTWKLRFCNTPGAFNPNTSADLANYASLTSSQYYVRQVRIEFLVDSTSGYSDIQYFNPARERLYKKTSRGFRSGKKLIDIISGSQWWDAGVSYIYAYQQPEYGRTVGITTDSADDYAVFTQLTGALATALTGTPSWFLNPPPGEGVSGLPYIPLSSASLGEYGQPIGVTGTAADMIAATVDQQLPVPSNNTLPAYLSRIRAIRKTQDLFEEQLIANQTGSYF